MSSATWRRWVPDTLEYPQVPVGALLHGAARRYGDRAAFVHHDRTLTFTELWRGACGLAHHLRARGVTPGEVVAVHLPNCLAFPVAYHGVLLAGCVFTPVSPMLGEADLAAQLVDGPAALAIGLRDLGALLPEGASTTIVTDGTSLDVAPADDPPSSEIDPSAALAHLAYTGGTTGHSKGVALTHRNVVANVLQFACHLTGSRPVPGVAGDVTVEQDGPPEEWPTRLGEGVAIAVAPWFHAMGTIGGVNVPILTGTTSVVHERFDPGRFLADVETHRASNISGAPPLFHALLAHPDAARRDLTSVRTVSSGAAPMPGPLARRLAERMPHAVLVEGYGLTEATMGLTIGATARSAHRVVGTVGSPVADTEIVVGAPDAPLPAGEAGEVWARGPQVMAGYHGREADTAEALVGGWLRTGDIGVLDADGLLSIVDRAKDMLIYKGYNVYPRELEELLAARPEVDAAAVVGRPDPAVGEEPVAVLVLVPDVVAGPEGGGDTPEQVGDRVAAAVNAQVAPYKRLRAVHLADALPTSAAGKVLKRDLRRELGTPVWAG